MKSFLSACRPDIRLLAVTVDHGLRPDSADEARRAGLAAARLGIAHAIRRWEGEKPRTGLMAAARRARYRLLVEAADSVGARVLFSGHTADDQAETVAMREARGGAHGLAGMAEATLLDGRVWLLRPLLAVRRAALRDRLAGAGLDWIDDPANADPRFERAGVRLRLAGRDAETARLLAVADAAARRRIRLGQAAAALIRRHADAPAPGLVRLSPAFADAEDREAAVHALRLLLAAAGGTAQLPDERRTTRFFDRIAAGPFRGTLSRCVVDCRSQAVLLHREVRARHWRDLRYGGKDGHLWPLQGEATWDGRFRVAATRALPGMAVTGLGGFHASRQAGCDAALPREHVWRALSMQPALVPLRPTANAGQAMEGTLLSPEVQLRNGLRVTPVIAPFATFLPAFDLAPAQALAGLFGAPQPLAPPCRAGASAPA